jgi:hypothetical protein
MDAAVKQAMEKWPNVPHCYGWLTLDARGAWRLRDEQAQADQRQGDRIEHVALLAFINRNYTCDARGCWYFQNGPQRVFVNLEATPFIAHTDGVGALVLHTGEILAALDSAWFTEEGQLLVQSGGKLALVDDRDLVDCLGWLRVDGCAVDAADVLAWVQGDAAVLQRELSFVYGGQRIVVQRVGGEDFTVRFGFVRVPAI